MARKRGIERGTGYTAPMRARVSAYWMVGGVVLVGLVAVGLIAITGGSSTNIAWVGAFVGIATGATIAAIQRRPPPARKAKRRRR